MKETKEKEQMLDALTRLLSSQHKRASLGQQAVASSNPIEANASGSLLARWWERGRGGEGGGATADQRTKELQRRELLRSPQLLDSVVQVSVAVVCVSVPLGFRLSGTEFPRHYSVFFSNPERR